MFVSISPLVTTTVGATESLIMVKLRKMREPQRKKKILLLTTISLHPSSLPSPPPLPLVSQKTLGKFLMLLHKQNRKGFKEKFGRGQKKISSMCSAS